MIRMSFVLWLLTITAYSQNTLIEQLDKLPLLNSFNGYSFTCQNNSVPEFEYNQKVIEIKLNDTIPINQFNAFVNQTLYPKRPKKLIPKMINVTGEEKIDSIRVTDVGILKPYTIDNKVRCAAKIFPLARRKVSESITEIMLLTDTPEGIYVECYSYSDEGKKILSYIPLFRSEKKNKQVCTMAGVCLTAAYQTSAIKEGIFIQTVNDGFNDLWERRIRLNENGHYELLWNTNPQVESQIFDAVINDTDGYSNVRRYPDPKATILYKILKDEKFQIEEFPQAKNWYRIFNYKNSYEGWIHKSRVTKIKAK